MTEPKRLDGTGKGECLYDYKHDILTFKIKDRNYRQSVEVQNYVIDVDDEGFVTGLRIFDATKVLGLSKLVLKNIIRMDFRAQIRDNVISVTLKLSSMLRNKILFKEKETFTQKITQESPTPLEDSIVVCPA